MLQAQHTPSDANREAQLPTAATKKINEKSRKKRHVNWHEAAACALQIDLKDYASFLEYMTEYKLGRGSYRIDILVIRKLTGQTIPVTIANLFRTFNLFEVKGIGSYYKTIGYAGLLIDQLGKKNQYSSLDMCLPHLSCHYPHKLMTHLQKERKIKRRFIHRLSSRANCRRKNISISTASPTDCGTPTPTNARKELPLWYVKES